MDFSVQTVRLLSFSMIFSGFRRFPSPVGEWLFVLGFQLDLGQARLGLAGIFPSLML